MALSSLVVSCKDRQEASPSPTNDEDVPKSDVTTVEDTESSPASEWRYGMDPSVASDLLAEILSEGVISDQTISKIGLEDVETLVLIDQLAAKDIDLALQLVKKLGGGEVITLQEYFEAALKGEKDYPVDLAATLIVDQFAGNEEFNALQILIEARGESHPETIAKELIKLSPGNYRSNLVLSLAQHWGSKDISEGYEWFQKNTDSPDDRSAAITGLGRACRNLPFEELAKQYERIDHDELRNSMAHSLGVKRGYDSGADTTDLNFLLRTYTKDDQLGEIMGGFVSALASNKPSELKNMLTSRSIPDAYTGHAYRTLARPLADKSSRLEVLDWLMEDGSVDSKAAFVNTFHEWLRAESSPAQDWLETLEPGEIKNHTMGIAVEHYLPLKDFASATKWLDQITDEQLYEEKAMRIAWNLARSDADAYQWADSLSDETVQANIRTMLDSGASSSRRKFDPQWKFD